MESFGYNTHQLDDYPAWWGVHGAPYDEIDTSSGEFDKGYVPKW
jgi:hypothetical protein